MKSELRMSLPVEYDRTSQRILASDHQFIAELRGWGYLTGTGGLHLDNETACEIQDARGEFIAKCINESTELAQLREKLAAIRTVVKDETICSTPHCRGCRILAIIDGKDHGEDARPMVEAPEPSPEDQAQHDFMMGL